MARKKNGDDEGSSGVTHELPLVDTQPTHVTPLSPPRDEVQVYKFRTYWGGENFSNKPPQIHTGLVALRAAIGGLEAKKVQGGPQFAIRSAKDLGIKLRAALDKCNLVCMVVGQDGGNIDTEKGTAAYVKCLVRVGAPDGSYVDFVGSGHGMDRDDKAGGKASTYAWKDALVKGLNLPDAEMVDTDDESGVGAEVTQRTSSRPHAGNALPSALEVQEALDASTAETFPALLEKIKAAAKAAGAAGNAWGMALTPAVQATKARLGIK